MNHDEQFDCSFGCESANQCEYYNNMPPNQVIPQMQNYVDNSNFYQSNNYDDGVVPMNQLANNIDQQPMQSYQNYPDQNVVQAPTFYNQHAGFSGGNYFTDTAESYPPCQGPQPWNFAQCYGYYGEAPCQFANVVDMEDFM